jgi:oligopeptide/dipeptide ABC transporter ATP-binding protein
LHPYTQGLLGSLPPLPGERPPVAAEKKRIPLKSIPGNLPDPTNLPAGCRFAERCSLVIEACREKIPELEIKRPDHRARCIRVEA